MNTLINQFSAGYTTMPNTVINRNDLSWKAKGILLYLSSKPEGWQFYVKDIEKHATDGEVALQSGLKELEALGYLERIPSRDEQGRMTGYDWHIKDPLAEPSGGNNNRPPENTGPGDTPSHSNTNTTSNTEYNNPPIVPPQGTVDSGDHSDSKPKPEAKPKDQHTSPEDYAAKIYERYPRHVHRIAAIKAITKALKRVQKEQEISLREAAIGLWYATSDYATSTYIKARLKAGDKSLIPHPATWFNKGGYLDDRCEWEIDPYNDADERKLFPNKGHVTVIETADGQPANAASHD